MRLEKEQQGGEQRRLTCTAPQLIGPDSGQVDEPLRPSFGTKRCRKRGKAERDRIIWYPGWHSLEQPQSG